MVKEATREGKGRSKEPTSRPSSSLFVIAARYFTGISYNGCVEEQQQQRGDSIPSEELGDGNSGDSENTEGGLSEDTFSFMK